MDKFTYDTSDFKPTIRKKHRPWLLPLSIAIVVVLLIALGVGVYKEFFYREKLDAKTAIARGLDDINANLFGEKSPILSNLEGDYAGLFTDGKFRVKTSSKIETIHNFDLGVETYLPGVSLKTDSLVDVKEKKFKTDIEGGWTIVSLPLLKLVGDNNALYISSETLVDETLVAYNDISAFLGVIDKLGIKTEDFDIPDLKVNYVETGKTEEVVCGGREQKGYEYLVELEEESGEKPLVIHLLLTKNYQVAKMVIDYEMTGDTLDLIKHLTGLDALSGASLNLEILFKGVEHPTDKITGDVLIVADGNQITGDFTYKLSDKKNLAEMEFIGSLLVPRIEYEGQKVIPKLDYGANIMLTYDKESGELISDIDMTDGADVLRIDSKGTILEDEDYTELDINFDKLTIGYGNIEDVITLHTKLALMGNDKEIKFSTPDKLINILDLDEETINGLIEEATDKISGLTESFGF